MARTIEEIYNELIYAKESVPGLNTLNSKSATAIWRLLLYVVAVCSNTLEKLIDTHLEEVDELISNKMPHRAKWYRDKTLGFMSNKTLVTDQDYYDTSGMSADSITAAKVVKHAVAVEDGKSSMLTIKVAGETEEGVRTPITSAELIQLETYLGDIKDAGVKINLINKAPDKYNAELDIYYDAMREPDQVRNSCSSTIKDYIQNLPFNGEYTNMALVDALQAVNGVKIVEMKKASAREDGTTGDIIIDARYTPAAGYFVPEAININMISYD